MKRRQIGGGFHPAWMSFEVQQALEAAILSNPSWQAKTRHRVEQTILQMAEREVSGQTVRAVFDRPDTVRDEAWYEALKHPDVERALKVAQNRARWWARVKGGKSLESALDDLVETAEDGAAQYLRAVREGRMTFDRDGQRVDVDVDVPQMVKIIESALNRVSDATAPKSTVSTKAYVTISPDDWSDDPEPDGN